MLAIDTADEFGKAIARLEDEGREMVGLVQVNNKQHVIYFKRLKYLEQFA
jgi:hypothetical protein